MKVIAIVLNIVSMIAISAICIIEEYLVESPEVLFCGLFFVCPVVNLIVMARSETTANTWLGLYFKRKRLEEQNRIKTLEKGDQ